MAAPGRRAACGAATAREDTRKPGGVALRLCVRMGTCPRGRRGLLSGALVWFRANGGGAFGCSGVRVLGSARRAHLTTRARAARQQAVCVFRRWCVREMSSIEYAIQALHSDFPAGKSLECLYLATCLGMSTSNAACVSTGAHEFHGLFCNFGIC